MDNFIIVLTYCNDVSVFSTEKSFKSGRSNHFRFPVLLENRKVSSLYFRKLIIRKTLGTRENLIMGALEAISLAHVKSKL